MKREEVLSRVRHLVDESEESTRRAEKLAELTKKTGIGDTDRHAREAVERRGHWIDMLRLLRDLESLED